MGKNRSRDHVRELLRNLSTKQIVSLRYDADGATDIACVCVQICTQTQADDDTLFNYHGSLNILDHLNIMW